MDDIDNELVLELFSLLDDLDQVIPRDGSEQRIIFDKVFDVASKIHY
jgi:hypothetical protein